MEIYDSNNNKIIADSNQTFFIASDVDYETLIGSINIVSYKLDIIKYITIVAIIVSLIMTFTDLYIHRSIICRKDEVMEAGIIDIEQSIMNSEKTKNGNYEKM
jgi:hypothetical protein